MKTSLVLLVFFAFLSTQLNGQKTDDILKEGIFLYHSEQASWHGTDYFLKNFPEKRESIGGYFSYESNGKWVNAFYSKHDDAILARMYFGASPGPVPDSVDIANGKATQLELDLISILSDAKQRVFNNEDRFFKFYENTSFNFIPVVKGKEKKVYLLTASTRSEVVFIGNDYLLSYNQKNIFKKKKRIHKSLIELPVKDDEGNLAIATFHSHVVSDHIDPTDICTLLLYREYSGWKQHYVVGKKYVSIFDPEKETLVVMKRKAWEKILEAGGN